MKRKAIDIMGIKNLGKIFKKAGEEVSKNADDIVEGAEKVTKKLGKNAQKLSNAEPGFRVGFEAVDDVLDNSALGMAFKKVDDINSVDSFIQKGVPYTLTSGAALTFATASIGKDLAQTGLKHSYNLGIGESQGFRKLSGMTDSILGPNDDSNMIVNPLIKAVADTSTPEAYAKGERVLAGVHSETRLNLQNSWRNQASKENLVFALHNLR